MADFLAMGGYAPYVWSAYGISLAVLLANVLAARRLDKTTRRRLALRLARQPQRREEQ